MIQTKEELFLAELGINTKEEFELAYGAKIKITDLLKKYEKQLTLTDVSQQRELLKKWWKYFDEKSVAVNCNEQEREEVINDFFNCA
mgnify:CR=1 FL=1